MDHECDRSPWPVLRRQHADAQKQLMKVCGGRQIQACSRVVEHAVRPRTLGRLPIDDRQCIGGRDRSGRGDHDATLPIITFVVNWHHVQQVAEKR